MKKNLLLLVLMLLPLAAIADAVEINGLYYNLDYEDSEVATKEISIEGSGLKGDVNGDGEVGIGDIISITNIMAE